MNNPGDIINRSVLRPGMILGRMTPCAISRAIVLRTAGVWALARRTAWSHDAIVIQHNHQWYLGDAEMGSKARLTPIEEWEDAMRYDGVRVIALWPTGATEQMGQAAAWWWQCNVYGRDYDATAIRDIAWRWLAEAFAHKVGREEDYYCTESCRDSWALGAKLDPWQPKLSPTPGTTRKRLIAGQFGAMPDALTEAGRRYAISI